MRRIIGICLVLSLSACVPMLSMLGGMPQAPVQVSNRTVLDEQAALGAELAYQAAATGATALLNLGFFNGAKAKQIADADNRAYRAVLAVRAAYDAGNATSYGAASAQARQAVQAIIDLIK